MTYSLLPKKITYGHVKLKINPFYYEQDGFFDIVGLVFQLKLLHF